MTASVRQGQALYYWLYPNFMLNWYEGYLDTNLVMKNKHRLCFGGVRAGKAYVSFHLIPVYASAELQKSISPELKKRMQGKSCFNFKAPDQKLFKELAKLTKAGFEKFHNPDSLRKLIP